MILKSTIQVSDDIDTPDRGVPNLKHNSDRDGERETDREWGEGETKTLFELNEECKWAEWSGEDQNWTRSMVFEHFEVEDSWQVRWLIKGDNFLYLVSFCCTAAVMFDSGNSLAAALLVLGQWILCSSRDLVCENCWIRSFCKLF